MSDIGIRLDGILLSILMVAGIMLFAAIAVASTLWALLTPPGTKRSWKIAARSGALAISHAVGLAILAAYLDEYGASLTGPDWIDWLCLPWSGFILFGLVLLVRTRIAAKKM